MPVVQLRNNAQQCSMLNSARWDRAKLYNYQHMSGNGLGIIRCSKACRASSTSSKDSKSKSIATPTQLPGEIDCSVDEVEELLHASIIGSRVKRDDVFFKPSTCDSNTYDMPDWDEVPSLLSFDAEEHKYVTRYMPKERQRVEDMMGSFDGDSFEAVVTACQGAAKGREPSATTNNATHATAAGLVNHSSSSAACTAAEGLFATVSRRRATALAAEQQNQKRPPGTRRRKARLGSQPADAWMFEVPVLVLEHPQRPTAEQYATTQLVLPAPLQSIQTSSDQIAAVPHVFLQQQHPYSDVVMLIQRSQESGAEVSAAAPVATQQQGVLHSAAVTCTTSTSTQSNSRHATLLPAVEGLVATIGSNSSRGKSRSRRLERIRGQLSNSRATPLTAASDLIKGLLDAEGAAAAVVATQKQNVHAVVQSLLASPALLSAMIQAAATTTAVGTFAAAADSSSQGKDGTSGKARGLGSPTASGEDVELEGAAQGFTESGVAAAGSMSEQSGIPGVSLQHLKGASCGQCGYEAGDGQHIGRSVKRALAVFRNTIIHHAG